MSDYATFLVSKAPRSRAVGVEPDPMPDAMFDFQRDVTEFCLRQGRAALFLGTGLGKTICQLEWSSQAAGASNDKALILTPLAVARQIEAEGKRFGYKCRVVRDQSEVGYGINICNYDRFEKLDPAAFGAVSLDESSIIKNLTGSTTRRLISAFANHRFRLCCTATPAPNDHMELGTHAEFLGVMHSNEMLSRWFINDTSTASRSWRLKRHAENAFWDWVASWARCADNPGDLGFDGSCFVLPELVTHRHKVQGEPTFSDGTLFGADLSATNMHRRKRETADARADIVGGLIGAEPDERWVIWCDNNAEADALLRVIPDAADVRGSMTADQKEEALASFAAGERRYLISKPSVCGFGMNWQFSARMAFVGRSFSYERFHQAVRRCWRFGQTRPVHVHIVVAEGEEQIGRVIDRKSDDHARMKLAMAGAMQRERGVAAQAMEPYNPTVKAKAPAWLTA